MFVPVPAPAADHDFLTAIEYFVFRLALLLVFVSWVVRHVVHRTGESYPRYP